MVSVVSLDATEMLPEDERWSGDEDDSGDGENGENTVPDRTPLLQEDPGQEGGKDRIAKRAEWKDNVNETHYVEGSWEKTGWSDRGVQFYSDPPYQIFNELVTAYGKKR